MMLFSKVFEGRESLQVDGRKTRRSKLVESAWGRHGESDAGSVVGE